MRKAEKMAAFEGIDTDILTSNRKNNEIVKLFLKGMTYKEIADVYGITAGRIGQILDKQARRANFYKKLQNDHYFQSLVEGYIEKLTREETIIIGKEINDKIKLMAANEARRRREALNSAAEQGWISNGVKVPCQQ